MDASQAFWQVELDEESSFLCTFGTPWGRYRFLRLPYGVCSAPEVFQAKMNNVLQGLQGTAGYFDDILVWGDKQTHNTHLKNVLQRCRENNLKLGKGKLQLAKGEVTFMGHKLTQQGIRVEPSKVKAIEQIPSPTSKQDLQRLLGMFNFLSKFIPNFSNKTEYLRKLLHQTSEWKWDAAAEQHLNVLKGAVTTAPVLAYFQGDIPVHLSVDASSHGLGAVMLQGGKPIAFASVSLTPTQCNYAQIEKELLAIVFACEAFHYYIFGKEVTIETDHKPLLSIHKKPLPTLSPRLQRLTLRLLRYQAKLEYVPGRYLHIADTLSRAPTKAMINTDYLEGEAEAIHSIMCVSTVRLQELKEATSQDTALQLVNRYTTHGWPDRLSAVHPNAKLFWTFRDNIHFQDSLLFYGNRIIIPSTLKKDMVTRIHAGHQGIVACKNKAREIMFWPGMSKDIEQLVGSCHICQEHSRSNVREPLLPHEVPSRPWKKVGIDFMHISNATYILVIDYFSKYVEIQRLSSTNATVVINSLKSVFARHGVPEALVSDNGPPFNSEAFKVFCRSWDITHSTSSPGYPRANGMAERAIQTVKSMLHKAERDSTDLYTVLLEYRSTPLCGLPSPAELLMGRRLRGLLPMTEMLLKPQFQTSEAAEQLSRKQTKMKHLADRQARPLPPLHKGQSVLYKRGHRDWQPATIVDVHSNPRSYIFRSSEGGIYRRNRVDLRPSNPVPVETSTQDHFACPISGSPDSARAEVANLPEQQSLDNEHSETTAVPHSETAAVPPRPSTSDTSPKAVVRTSRFGRAIRTPSRFKDFE